MREGGEKRSCWFFLVSKGARDGWTGGCFLLVLAGAGRSQGGAVWPVSAVSRTKKKWLLGGCLAGSL